MKTEAPMEMAVPVEQVAPIEKVISALALIISARQGSFFRSLAF